jgi:hypothetical protein
MVAITEATSNYTDLLKQADAASNLAKDLGRNRIHVYHPADSFRYVCPGLIRIETSSTDITRAIPTH